MDLSLDTNNLDVLSPSDYTGIYFNEELGIKIDDLSRFLSWNSGETSNYIKLSGRHTRSSTYPVQVSLSGITYDLNIKGNDLTEPRLRVDPKDGSIKMMGFETLEDVEYVIANYDLCKRIPGFVTEIPLLIVKPKNIPLNSESIPQSEFAYRVPVLSRSSFMKADRETLKAEEDRVEDYRSTAEFVIVLRLLPCAHRIEDLEDLTETQDPTNYITQIAAKHNLETDPAQPVFSYLSALCYNTASQLGILHAQGAIHGCISSHNITMTGHLVDLDSFEFHLTQSKFIEKSKREFGTTRNVITNILLDFYAKEYISDEQRQHLISEFHRTYSFILATTPRLDR